MVIERSEALGVSTARLLWQHSMLLCLIHKIPYKDKEIGVDGVEVEVTKERELLQPIRQFHVSRSKYQPHIGKKQIARGLASL